MFVSARTGNADVAMVEGRDIGMEEAMKSEDACDVESAMAPAKLGRCKADSPSMALFRLRLI